MMGWSLESEWLRASPPWGGGGAYSAHRGEGGSPRCTFLNSAPKHHPASTHNVQLYPTLSCKDNVLFTLCASLYLNLFFT